MEVKIKLLTVFSLSFKNGYDVIETINTLSLIFSVDIMNSFKAQYFTAQTLFISVKIVCKK